MAGRDYTIYDLTGHTLATIRLLVHGFAADQPDNSETFTTLILRRLGTTYYAEYSAPDWITAMWESGDGTVYAVSMSGQLHTNDGGTWHSEVVGKFFFNDVWGTDQLVWACGLDAVSMRRVLGRWERFDEGLTGDLRRIDGTGPTDIYIIGKRGEIFHYDGARWSRVESPTNYPLVGILCVSPEEIYVCGRKGVCFRGSRAGWRQLRGPDISLHGLVAYQGKILVAAGLNGILQVVEGHLVDYDREVEAYGLHAVDNRLLAFAEKAITEFDGRTWSKRDIDITRIDTT